MYQALVPCPSCTRHIRAAEKSCPFCKCALPDSLASAVVPAATTRLSRAAAFAFTASIAVTGCGAGTSPIESDSGAKDGGRTRDEGGLQPPYGSIPLEDAGPLDDAGLRDAGPPVDAGSDAADAADAAVDDGGGQTLYGAPAYGAVPTDSGKD